MPSILKKNDDKEDVKVTKKLMDDLELKMLIRQNTLNKNIIPKDALAEKKQKIIHFLEKEKENLKKDLNLMTSEMQCLMQSAQVDKITQLFGQRDSLDLELVREKKYIEDLEMQINHQSIQLKRFQKKKKNDIKSDDRYLELHKKADSNSESMKSKLHAKQVQLSTETSENADLRKRIVNQLKDKARFNQMIEEELAKLKKGKIVLRDVVEQSKKQLTRRDEVARKIQALKDRDAADLKRSSEEMQNLNMKIFEDTALSTYKKKMATLRIKLYENPKASLKVKLQRRKDERRLEWMDDAWDKVKEESNLMECKEVCEIFVRNDAENFSLFTYNNELSCQLEALTEKSLELIRKLEDEQDLVYQWEDDEERKNADLVIMLNVLEEQVGVESDEMQTNNRTFERLRTKIKGLFEMLKCDPSPLQQLLGDNEEVTEFNFKLYFGHVETRLMSLLSVLPRVTDITVKPSQGFSLPPVSLRNVGSPLVRTVVEDKVITRSCVECEEKKRKPA